MRKILLKILLLVSLYSYSQNGVVSDPGVYTRMAKALLETKKGLEEFNKMNEELNTLKEQQQETLDFVNKVRSKVKEVKAISDISNNVQKIYSESNNVLNLLSENQDYLSSNKVQSTGAILNTLNESSADIVNFIFDLLKDNTYTMTDYERIDLIEKQKQKTEIIYRRIFLIKKKLKRSISTSKFKQGQF